MSALDLFVSVALVTLGASTIAFAVALGFSVPLLLIGALFLMSAHQQYRIGTLEARDR